MIKFSYPDLPYIDNRVLYDYLLHLENTIRKMGLVIEELQTQVGVTNGNV